MQIVYVCSSGAHEYWINLANAISKKCNLHLFLPDSIRKTKIPQYLEEAITIHYFKKFKFYDIRNMISILRVYKKIVELSPNVIHLPGGIPFGLPIIYPLIKLRFPLVITAHEPVPKTIPLYDMLLLKIQMIFADAMIVAGEAIKKEAMLYWKNKKLKIFVVPFGAFIHYNKLRKPNVNEEEGAVLFFGAITPHKGPEYLIEAEPLVSRKIQDFKIIVAGKGFGRYKQLIREPEFFEIHDRYVSDQELCELFQRASVVVLPYVSSFQSGVIFTAYAFLKPVIVTNVGSLPESVSHLETELVIKPRSARALSKAIITLLENKELRNKMKENIYRKVTQEYSWDGIASMMLKTYCKTVKSEGSDLHVDSAFKKHA
jgi:glycosyltransferase involved in cell wall biosynthesis